MRRKKVVATLLLFLIVFSNTSIIWGTEISSAKLLLGESCGNHIQFKYPGGWSTISGNIIYYKANGTTYPAYCISSGGTPGVDEKGSYTVNISEVLDDVRVWRVIINGYPYKTPAQMGVSNKADAYFATKQSIYSILFDREVTKLYRGLDDRGKKIVSAMDKLVDIGRNGTQTPEDSNLTVTAVNDLVEDGDYYYQEYKVTSAVDMSTYTITSTKNLPTDAFIADMDGNKQTSFTGTENFKLMIPKTSMATDIKDVAIGVQGKCKTYPVFYGETTVSGWQDYAVTYDPYGDDSAIATLSAETNTGSIKVVKTDEDTDAAISGVTFELSSEDGTVLGTATTNSSGIAQFNSLYQGKYILKEISTNEKYILDETSYEVTVEYDKVTTKELTNKHKKGSISVLKVDKDNTSIPLPNVVFDLYSKEFNKVVGTYTTDSQGKIQIDDLRIGNYVLQEKSTNEWYNLGADTPIIVNWNSNTDKTITNELKKSKVKVVKEDLDDSSVKLEGVKFEVLDTNKNVLEIITTDKNGEAFTTERAIRDFESLIIREKSTLNNYVLTSQEETIELEEGKVNTVTFTNELKKGQIKIIKEDLDDGNVKLDGITFEVKDNVTGKVVETLVTDSNGVAISSRLRSDRTYTVTETKTKDNYVLNTTPQTATLKYNEVTTLTFKNELKKGQIKLVKIDLDNNEVKLKGVTFEVKDNVTGKVVETLVTDENGVATSGRLRSDRAYTVTETKTLSNYVLTTETQTATLKYNEVTTLTFKNELKKGQIKITKEDLDNASIKLKGVTFAIIDNTTGQVVETLVTDENGEATSSRLRSDRTYTVTETKTLSNYVLTTETQVAIVNYNETTEMTFKNEKKKGQIKIVKSDYDNNEIKLEGIKFEIRNEAGTVVDTLVTDSNGEAVSKRLPIDEKYTVKEVATKIEYVLNVNAQEVTLKQNEVTTLEFTNELKKGTIKIIKQDLDDNAVKLEGITFEIKDNVTGKVVETLVTDKNGEATSSRLRSDRTYTVTETKTLSNYVLTTTPQTATLKYNETTTLTFNNELKKGRIKIIKVDYDNNDIKLDNITFEIKDNVTGKVVEALVTNKNGEATSSRLRSDRTYTVTETKTKENYVLNTTPQTATLTYNDITTLTFTNEKKKGQIKVVKVDYDDNSVKLEGVTFEVRTEDGTVVDTLITDKNGEAITKRLPIDQKYVLVEVATRDEYVLDSTPKKLEVAENKISLLSMTNEKIKGYLQVHKTSEEDNEYSELPAGSNLSGAVFEVYDKSGNLVDRLTTDINGIAITKPLLKGVYVLKEIQGPNYYLTTDKVFFAEITEHKQVSKLAITNENVELDVSIDKYGFIETQQEDNIYYEFENISNNSNVSVNNFTWQDNLPTDALRLNTIYTGTWNEDLSYSVYYKTNKNNEYKLFVDGLKTTVNNKIEFTQLKLAKDEYVTSFELRFGTVKSGFREIERPVVYCDMVSKLGNGYLFTNKTKVYATYLDKTLEDNDTWNTITYYKDIQINEELPKTGK